MTTPPEPPPEARLIAKLRDEKVPSLSMREAARRAGMAPATWTQNEQGYRKVGPGVVIPIRATDDKLAAMALIVGATPAQLAEAGREGAARALEVLQQDRPADPREEIAAIIRHGGDLDDRQRRVLLDLLKRHNRD